MSDADTNELLRVVLDEVRLSAPFDEAAKRQRVAARLRELIDRGQSSIEDLKQAARDAPDSAPTMWH